MGVKNVWCYFSCSPIFIIQHRTTVLNFVLSTVALCMCDSSVALLYCIILHLAVVMLASMCKIVGTQHV